MRFSTTFALATAIVCSTLISAKTTLNANFRKTNVTTGVVPNRYIVEFDTNAHLQSSPVRRAKRAATPHEFVYAQLDARAVSYTVNTEYTSDIFIGASVTVGSDSDLASLSAVTGVVNISPVRLMHLPETQGLAQTSSWTGSGTQSAFASSVSASSLCSTSSSKKACAKPAPTTGFSNLPYIGADKVQAAGNKGKGVKIGIIDTGVDYTRAPLGGCFGAGCKIAGGYDFVGDAYDGTNTPVPDSDPFDNCNEHGTFVSGIIGANDNEFNVTGVAPEASLYMYRVFGCTGSAGDDVIVSAMSRAYQDGMDVINLSLGEISGWTEGALGVVASRLAANGTVIVASAGNLGQIGAFYSATPASGRGVIGVGSVNNTILPAHNASVSTGYGNITYYNFRNFPAVTLPLYAYTLDPNVQQDGCFPTATNLDLSNKVLIVRQVVNPDDTCSDSVQAKTAYTNYGNRAIIVVPTSDSEPVYENYYLTNFAYVGKADGEYLLSQLAAGVNVSLTFGYNPAPRYNKYSGGLQSYFSETGPTYDQFMSTQVSAPGTNIISTAPSTLGNWTIRPGTSWSSAFGAGAAALYLNAKGTNTATSKVVQALEYSASPVNFTVGGSTYKTVAASGSGVFNVNTAINSALVVSPTEILLNDTANFAGLQYIQLSNTGSSSQTYTLKNVPAGTALTLDSSNNQSYVQEYDPLPQVSNAASIWFSKTSVTVKSGQSTIVIMYFTKPSGLDATTYPVYSGFVQITGGNLPVQIPYMGVAANMKNHPVLDGTNYYLGANLPTTLDNQLNVADSGLTFTFQGVDHPSALIRLAGGTRFARLDLIVANQNLTFAPNYNSRRSLDDGAELVARQEVSPVLRRSLVEERDRQTTKRLERRDLSTLLSIFCQITQNKGFGCAPASTGSFNNVTVAGNLQQWAYAARNNDGSLGDGNDYSLYVMDTPTFANGTTIPNGSYRFLFRGLKVGGDITSESDYDTWLGVPFNIAA